MGEWGEYFVVFAFVGAAIYAFYMLAADVKSSAAVARFDQVVSDHIFKLRRPWLDRIMKLATYAGGTIGITVFTFALVFALIDLGKMSQARFSAVLVIGGTILANGLKPFLKRVRPSAPEHYIKKPSSSSFPSGHSMASMCLGLATIEAVLPASSITTPIKALIVILALLYVLLVGFSRVYLGVHWPSDVVASWLLGTAWITGATGWRFMGLERSEQLEILNMSGV
ncbi:MAG: phosphatase PAP2 family protein [Actinomycetia bacterium]|nr:phosphatase PAP2 family protein [Actinomycetes bacterium]